MFYMETRDGECFLTDAKSDDKLEFERILEQKLGKDAVEIFNQLINDAKHESQDALVKDLDYVISELRNIQDELS